MKMFRSISLVLIVCIPLVTSNCIWYEGIRGGFNEIYLNGPPKPLPLEDIPLLNNVCPHIATQHGKLELFVLCAVLCKKILPRCLTKFML